MRVDLQASYYDGMPFQPGVAAFAWLSEHVGAARALDVRLPDTVVLHDGDVHWLRSKRPTGLVPQPFQYRVHTVDTTSPRWKRQFKRLVCPHLGQPQSLLSPAQQLTPVAVVRFAEGHTSTHTNVVVQGVYDSMVKEAAPGAPTFAVQAFVRCKGLKPSVYRLLWKRGRPGQALAISSKYPFFYVRPPVRLHVCVRACVCTSLRPLACLCICACVRVLVHPGARRP